MYIVLFVILRIFDLFPFMFELQCNKSMFPFRLNATIWTCESQKNQIYNFVHSYIYIIYIHSYIIITIAWSSLKYGKILLCLSFVKNSYCYCLVCFVYFRFIYFVCLWCWEKFKFLNQNQSHKFSWKWQKLKKKKKQMNWANDSQLSINHIVSVRWRVQRSRIWKLIFICVFLLNKHVTLLFISRLNWSWTNQKIKWAEIQKLKKKIIYKNMNKSASNYIFLL